MKLLTLALGLLLASCAVEVPEEVPAPNVHIVNSAWEVVRSDTLAHEITSMDGLEAEVATYNAAHTDDQWRLIYGDVPPVEAAPTADAYIVTVDTHEPRAEFLGIQRADLVERRVAWRLEVELQGLGGAPCVLYVDNVPPAPTPPEPVDPYVQYALYIVNSAGAVMFEEHPGAAQYSARLTAYQLEIALHNIASPADPWSLVTGRLWP